MAKRVIVDANEEKMKLMIAGEIPIQTDPRDIRIVNKFYEETQELEAQNKRIEKMHTDAHTKAKTKIESCDVSEADEQKLIDSEPKTETNKSYRRKKSKTAYAELFLMKPTISHRRQLSIVFDETNYFKILEVLKITNGITIANFINNLVSSHFEEYKEEINEVLCSFTDDLCKKYKK